MVCCGGHGLSAPVQEAVTGGDFSLLGGGDYEGEGGFVKSPPLHCLFFCLFWTSRKDSRRRLLAFSILPAQQSPSHLLRKCQPPLHKGAFSPLSQKSAIFAGHTPLLSPAATDFKHPAKPDTFTLHFTLYSFHYPPCGLCRLQRRSPDTPQPFSA